MFRCDAVTIVYHVTEYDEKGLPVGEMQTTPVKRFRAKTSDLWADGDKAAAQAEKEPMQ